MSSDIDYGYYDYNSSQNYSDIEDQIDSFEIRQCMKGGKHRKLKVKQSLCPITSKKLRSQPILLKSHCQPDKQKPKAQTKVFRYQHAPSYYSKPFEYDRLLQKKNSDSNEQSQIVTFNDYREDFYRNNCDSIKSSLNNYSNAKIVDIRSVSVDESVQNQFITQMKQYPTRKPQLVYCGTTKENLNSILQQGFPKSNQEPIPKRLIYGQFNNGEIYSHRYIYYPMFCAQATNTILICAAMQCHFILKRKQRCNKNIVLTSHASQIVPLFFLDFVYLNGVRRNYSHFYQPEKHNIVKESDSYISKRYLRKVLNCMHDYTKHNQQYQKRTYNYCFD